MQPDTKLSHVSFIGGHEELLIIDEFGLARVFSLVTEQFKYVVPAS